MEYDEQHSAVTYHSDKHSGPTAGSETNDALEFLAKLTSHIPDKGQVVQRYYGHYASRVRGMRRKAGNDDDTITPVMVDAEPETVREAKRRWAELRRRIFEVDPLACPRCGEEMRIVSFITELKTIDRILEHLRRTQTSRRRQRAPPRRRKSATSTASASSHTQTPRRPPLLAAVAAGVAGLRSCGNSALIAARSRFQTPSESTTETSRAVRDRLHRPNPAVNTCEWWIEIPSMG